MGEQTTVERIRELIFVSITPGDLHNPWSENPGILATQIAAEIDAKDKRIAELEGLLREHEGVTRDAVAQTMAGAALAVELAAARVEIAKLTPLGEIHDAWRKLHAGKESPSEESVVRFIEFAHAAAGRAYEASK